MNSPVFESLLLNRAKFDAISFNREQFSKAVQRVLTSLRAWEWEKVLKWSFHFPSLTEYLAATIKI